MLKKLKILMKLPFLILNELTLFIKYFKFIKYKNKDLYLNLFMGIGDWGLGPIPNPHLSFNIFPIKKA